MGPTGVGKTELSKALAECLFGNEDSMIRIDMSEYMEPHSISKLIGSPPGYVGFDEGGQLTEKVRRKPYTVLLLDEIEKAHPDVMNMLLQILEDGRLTDSQGRTVNFKNTVIIMTSNIGARAITDRKTLGFTSFTANISDNRKENMTSEIVNGKEILENKEKLEKVKAEEKKQYESIKKDVMAELKREFRPEFINRIDEIIVFHKLNEDEIMQIIDILLKQVEKRLKQNDYEVRIDESVKKLIAKKGFDANYGARPLRRAIQSYVEDVISEAILNGSVRIDKPAVIVADDEKCIVK